MNTQGTTFDSGSVLLLELCLRVEGRHKGKETQIFREYPWQEIASITFVHKWPNEHALDMKAKANEKTLTSLRMALNARQSSK